MDLLARRIGEVAGGLEIVGEGGDPEHAAAVGDQSPLLIVRGPGVEDDHLPVIRVESTAPLEPSVHTIDPQEEDMGLPADSGEWLRSLLGVSGKRLGGHGIDPVVRGQGENRVNILLDGA